MINIIDTNNKIIEIGEGQLDDSRHIINMQPFRYFERHNFSVYGQNEFALSSDCSSKQSLDS